MRTLSPFTYGVFLIAAGLAVGLAALAIVAILVWGGWPVAQYGAIIAILGQTLMGAGGLLTMVLVFLGIGGPIRRAKVGGSKVSLEVEGD